MQDVEYSLSQSIHYQVAHNCATHSHQFKMICVSQSDIAAAPSVADHYRPGPNGHVEPHDEAISSSQRGGAKTNNRKQITITGSFKEMFKK